MIKLIYKLRELLNKGLIVNKIINFYGNFKFNLAFKPH